ncbi:substrate-binding domain-containing protein [Vibrio viridaestus]|uniref:Autoinducer 2-binding periplasmic protein LuxP n=1 Tax=Vibrio viridaestus TaxID=2487322 RepID=A0A3N9TAF8_9VIBR|nr:substrate-binding domain-containing protein [Vibrio viridaestus]RQW61009.1 hypothetical protein EES38_21655 [Vibrio viridaestus]
MYKLLITSILNLIIVFFCPYVFASGKSCLVMVISGSPTRDFWAETIDGARRASEELGYTLYIRGTVNDKDSKSQIEALSFLMKSHNCVGILVAPADISLNSAINLYLSQNIPVIYFDRDFGGSRLASVTTDNYQAGVLAARIMTQHLDSKGDVVLFRVKKGIESTDKREQGFIDESVRLGLNIIAAPYVGTRVGESRATISAVLSAISNINGIFTPNDTSTTGVIAERRLLSLASTVVHIGFDESEYIKESLNNRALAGYLKQDAFRFGYDGVYLIHDALNDRLDINHSDIRIPASYISK